jgi:hypothetical protein
MRAAGTLMLLCGAAEAQDGPRSPSLPESSTSTVGGERDLFRVPPDFYARRPDPDASALFFPFVLPFPQTFVPPPWYPYPYPPGPGVPHYDARDDGRRRSDREAISAIPAAPSTPPAPMLPGKPKTFYVIPACYMGDRPPEPEWLPAGCDRSKMRVIPPG